ncbi:MAG TPA: DNA-processing protein DprA, partial [Gemmatimonadales bacterium]|nr:DNA-processing protein DprA [Gemmatimonadales bacterium]
MDDARAAWLALALVPGIGPSRFHRLLETFETPLGALSAPFAFLCAVPGMTVAAATAVRGASLDQGRRLLASVDRYGGHVLLPPDPEYPAALRLIPEAPTALFAQGDLSLISHPAVAIVGSRDHSSYGGEVCRRLSWAAAEAGAVVVSGMARGLDAVAHGAALDAGGRTVGVLGNGLGVVYPSANRRLYDRVRASGLLLTEFPPGERPNAGSFPRRNRIISGLARVTVVVEAGGTSGALITAGTALDQGREVMVVPGPITSERSVGCNRLIRDGAAPLLEERDLLEHYPDVVPPTGARARGTGGVPSPLPDTLGPAERRVAELIGAEPAE